MMKTKLLKPRLPYMWEFLVAEPHPVTMKEAKKFIEKQIFSCIHPETMVRFYIRIEKEGGPRQKKRGKRREP